MKSIGIFQGINKKAGFVILLFLLFSLEPPILLPFGFPRTTWGVAKIGLLFISFITFWEIWIRQKDFFSKRKSIFFAPALFLLSILLSILFAANLDLTSLVFLFLIIALFFYFLAIYYFKKIREIELFFKVILFLAVFSSFFSFFLVFQNRFQGLQFIHNTLINIFSYEGIFRFTGDLQRGRIQTFWFPEFAFPVILYFIFSKKSLKLGIFGLILSVIGILLSNNRYQFVSMCLGSLLFLFVNWRLIRKQKFLLKQFFVISIIATFLSVIAANYFLGNNVFQRFLLKDHQQDVESLESRQYLFGQSWEMFLSSPIFGVGFRNFSFYAIGEQGYFSDPLWKLDVPTYYWHLEPHNIFFQVLSETGLFGLISFLILLAIFLKQDIYLYKHLKTSNRKMFFSALIISSWMYIVNEQFTFINDSLSAGVFFWFTRGLLAAFFFKIKSSNDDILSNKQKIAVFIEKINSFGGIENQISLQKKYLSKDYDFVIFDFPSLRRWHPRIFYYLFLKLWKERPNIIMSYCEYPSIVAGLMILIYPFPIKLIVNEHNNPSAMFAPQKFKWFKKKIIFFIYNAIAVKIIVISRTIKNDLNVNFGIKKEKIKIIPLLIPVELIKKKSLAKIEFPSEIKNRNYFLAVGRLSKEKRYDFLIKVFKKVSLKDKKLKLVIVGGGREKRKLQSLVRALNLQKKVYLLGWLDNPMPYIKKAIALVITSKTEGVPNVAIESMIIGTPVISADYDGVEEIINNEVEGIIFNKNDPRLLEEILLKRTKNIKIQKAFGSFTNIQNKYNHKDSIQKHTQLLNMIR